MKRRSIFATLFGAIAALFVRWIQEEDSWHTAYRDYWLELRLAKLPLDWPYEWKTYQVVAFPLPFDETPKLPEFETLLTIYPPEDSSTPKGIDQHNAAREFALKLFLEWKYPEDLPHGRKVFCPSTAIRFTPGYFHEKPFYACHF